MGTTSIALHGAELYSLCPIPSTTYVIMASYTVSSVAYQKIMLHAAKHPSRTVCGYLVGPKPVASVDGDVAGANEGGRNGTNMVADAVPLFHSDPLAPMLEAAALLVEELYKSQSYGIVGYYQANERYEEKTLGVVGSLIGQKVNANCPGACMLVVDNTSLGSANASSLLLYTSSKHGEDFVRRETGLAIEGGEGTLDKLTALLNEEKMDNLVDFDDHLEKVSLDFRNEWVV